VCEKTKGRAAEAEERVKELSAQLHTVQIEKASLVAEYSLSHLVCAWILSLSLRLTSKRCESLRSDVEQLQRQHKQTVSEWLEKWSLAEAQKAQTQTLLRVLSLFLSLSLIFYFLLEFVTNADIEGGGKGERTRCSPRGGEEERLSASAGLLLFSSHFIFLYFVSKALTHSQSLSDCQTHLQATQSSLAAVQVPSLSLFALLHSVPT
jgi:hypothetical protein